MNFLSSLRIAAVSLPLAIFSETHAQKINNELEISGWLRANIQDKSYSDDDHKLKFDAAKLAIKYQSEPIGANFEYRCYQFDKICDFAALVDANLSYHFNGNNQHKITLGIQELPFGPARNWSSNWYGGLLVNTGLEDVHNLGINYQYPFTPNTQMELAYFPTDAGDYHGESKDSARYSANFVHTGSENDFSDLEERNLWLFRLKHKIQLTDDLSLNIGGSYWYSTIDNTTVDQTGKSERWAAFGNLAYDALALTVTAGRTQSENKDPVYPDSSMVGSFDTAYAVANDGNFYTVDLFYHVDLNENSTISPYFTYSYFEKSASAYKDSSRYIAGTQWDFHNIAIAAEYIVGRNDYFIGGSPSAFAAGDRSNESLFNILFLYNF